MKKVIYLLVLACMASCADVTQMSYRSKYQKQTLSKFSKKKSNRYVSARKRGDYRHPMVTKDTYKSLKQRNQ